MDINHFVSQKGQWILLAFFALKEALEEWLISDTSLYTYFKANFVTAWAVLIPSTKIAWRVFKDLPKPPTELKQALNYTG